MPPSTEFVLALGGIPARIGWTGFGVIIVVLTLCLTILRVYLKTDIGRLQLSALRLRIPLLGRIHEASSLARFCRTLGLLLANEAPIVESLDLAAASGGDASLRRAGLKATHLVANGESIINALEETNFLRPSACWVLRHGEEQGMLDQTLLRMADTLEREVKRRDRMALLLLGPIATIIVGHIVGFMITALFMPILKVTNTLM